MIARGGRPRNSQTEISMPASYVCRTRQTRKSLTSVALSLSAC